MTDDPPGDLYKQAEALPPLPPKWSQPWGHTPIVRESVTWTVRVVFAWTGPIGVLDVLREAGTLADIGDGEYAWTTAITGDTGPGTAEERGGRAAWLALLDENDGPAQWFTHRSTVLLDGDGRD